MNQATQKKLDRILEIRGEMAALEEELEQLLGGTVREKKPRGGGAKRKYRRRVKSEDPEPEEAAPARPAETPRTPSSGKPCCGTMGFRHKKGCPVAASKADGKLPPDDPEEKTWKCLNCDNRQKAEEQPEECDKCPGTVFVEVEAWQA